MTGEVLETANFIFRQDHFCEAWLEEFDHLSNFVLTQVKNLQALHLKGRTYLQILQLIREVFEELDVFDLVLGGVDAEKVFQMDDFCDVSDVVLAKV